MRNSILAIFVAIIATTLFGKAVAHTPSYSFGIVPQQSASKLARLWGPILREVGSQAGIELRFATARDIPTFESRLANGEYDFSYMNPYHFTVFHESSGYQALAKARDKRIKGILVVRKDSNINSLADLDAKKLAFPAPAAFAATILTQSHLNASGINFESKYVSSHDSVYRAVAKGLYPAGGGVIRTFKNVAPEVREQLKIFWVSEGFTPHAIAAHPRIPPEVVNRLQLALVSLETSEAGRELLQSIRLTGLEPAQNADWDDVRQLGLDRLSY